jgi:hypothetical protein
VDYVKRVAGLPGYQPGHRDKRLSDNKNPVSKEWIEVRTEMETGFTYSPEDLEGKGDQVEVTARGG